MSTTLEIPGPVFIQGFNAMKGKPSWEMKPKDYDYYREVARSAYADMLHDYERNRLYYEGLRATIRKMRSAGMEIHVLDIGTGTGLLSMMAAEIGVDSITAIEEFNPIANVAESIIASNGFSGKIKIVRKRSTNVTVGKGKDMERRANLLVTEVFDTELIGEGAIGVFNHAHKELLTDDCFVVPCECIMYAQVVSSDLAARWNSFHPIKSGDVSILPPEQKESGVSSALALHDVQLTQFKREWFTAITDPVPIFKFDFENSETLTPLKDQVTMSSKALSTGSCDAVFVWWDAFMDPDRRILMSCAPFWAHPDKSYSMEDLPWRNHWMQAIYYPSERIRVERGESLSVSGYHNEYSLAFDVSLKPSENTTSTLNEVVPFGGIHLAGISRTRLGQMNDEARNLKFIQALQTHNSKHPGVILSLSDLSLLPLMAGAATNASKIYISKQNKHMETLLRDFISSNTQLKENRFVFLNQNTEDLRLDDIPNKIDLIIGEPFFSSCYLPWFNLFYWYKLHELKKQCSSLSSVAIMPKKMEVWAMPVEFKDLWKIRSPLGSVEGFKVSHFDDVIMKACDVGDADVEPQPLWEYPCKARSKAPIKLMSFHLDDAIEGKTSKVSIPAHGKVNGMALWADWFLTEDIVDSSGPLDASQISLGDQIEWNIHSKQGVYFFKNASTEESDVLNIECSTVFDASEGDVKFSFGLNLAL